MSFELRNFYEIGQKVNDEPLVTVFEDFLSDTEIDALLQAAQSQLKPALVSSAQSGVKSKGRSGSNCWIPHTHSKVISQLSLRVEEIVGLPLSHAESLQVVHYDKSEEYAPHYDAWTPDTERGRRCMAKGGQRLLTCLLYLNDVEHGGGTSFPKLDMEIRAKKGRMVIFHNCYPGRNIRHPDSLHGGMPVLKGEKWACNFWFREDVYQPPGAVPERELDEQDLPKFNRVI